ncbi:Tn5252%2C Orf 10 protein [Streptococcus pneumoniae]|nr:Tn5252%2C Orf 10 protein [Streptococcus pneumoniae]CWF40377.1 Tn5252%2C Orf 10 protein [Streptococcus pneumoniae]VQI99437.1 Tn5252, Orf 10 protein [Streptococcus pneumoniae]VQS48062.1 Tn5252, Orf 10 protein [Streptococcus pneumoniae]VRA88597.1 Tn5252, Orf 10 protein [Streptococcus pneumoniae]
MSEQYRDIRKEVNLTADELKQIEKMMEVDNYRHFSSFVRDKSLNRSVEMCIWF